MIPYLSELVMTDFFNVVRSQAVFSRRTATSAPTTGIAATGVSWFDVDRVRLSRVEAGWKRGISDLLVEWWTSKSRLIGSATTLRRPSR